MKLLIKENKILLVIIAIAVIISFITIGGRISVESRNKNYDVVLDYNEIKAMAEQSDHDVSWWLGEFRKMGITKVGLAEESMASLMENKDLPVSADIMDIIMQDANWESQYPADFIKELKDVGYDKYDVLIEAALAGSLQFYCRRSQSKVSDRKLFYQTDRQRWIYRTERFREADALLRKI